MRRLRDQTVTLAELLTEQHRRLAATAARPARRARARPDALPPARRARLGRRPEAAEQRRRRRRAAGLGLLRAGRQLRLHRRPRRGQRGLRRAGAAAPASATADRAPSCSPTASPAAPRSSRLDTGGARPCTWPSCSPRPPGSSGWPSISTDRDHANPNEETRHEPTVADYLLQRLREWGVEQVFGYPGDGINGLLAASGSGPTTSRASSRPGTRRWRAFEAVRLRQVLRPGRRLHGDLGPGRDPPAQRPVRRQARPRPGRRDRRADQPQRDGRQPTSRRSTCSACSRTWPASTARWSPCPSSCPTCSTGRIRIAMTRQRTVTAVIIPADVQELEYIAAGARVQDGALEPGHHLAAPVADGRRDLQRAADGAQRRRARSRCWSARGPAAPPTEVTAGRRPARRRGRQGAARQGRALRRAAVGDRLDRAARHPAELRDDDGLRHPAHGRLELPLHAVPARVRPGPRPSRSTSTRR